MMISPSEPDDRLPHIDLTIEELEGLYKALEHEFISFENEAAHSAIRKIQAYIHQHGLANRINLPTSGT